MRHLLPAVCSILVLFATACASTKGGPMPLTAGISYSKIDYTETNAPDYDATVLTGKVNYHKAMKVIEFGVGGYYTLSALKKEPDIDAKFLGVNARLGFGIQLGKTTRLSILGGGYYTTMSVEGDAFGFKNLSGPQGFALLRKQLSQRNSLEAYAKYAWIKNETTNFSSESREIAAGGGFTHLMGGKRPLSLTVDYSKLHLVLTRDTIDLGTLSFGLAIGIL